MSQPDNFLMSQPASIRLCRVENAVLATRLATRCGGPGLYLSRGEPVDVDTNWPPAGTRVRLRLDATCWRGDVCARSDEPLPFVDGAFSWVVLQHVLEWSPHAARIVDEAVRVLEPGGFLAVAGFHPFSPWVPWLLCRHRPRPMLTPSGWLRQRLAVCRAEITHVQRCGHALPTASARVHASWIGGGFVLLARKRRAAIVPLKPARRQRAASARPSPAWVPETRRGCA